MSGGYSIDIEAARNSKLFKKFMESKNKSNVSAPRIDNVEFMSDRLGVASPISRNTTFETAHTMTAMATMAKNTTFNNKNHSIEQENVQLQIPRMTVAKVDENVRANGQGYRSTSRGERSIEKNRESVEQKLQVQQQQRREHSGQINEGEPGKKYDRLLEQYNQLRERLAAERKQAKKQLIKCQEQNEILSKKVFQLRNREDELILETKRMKQKSVHETKQKSQLQQTNRELSYQVSELRDMLDGKQNSSRKNEDQVNRWRKANEDLRQKIKEQESQIGKLKDFNNVLEREKFMAVKDANNKQLLINEMRQKINELINENGTLKDEIYHITSKLYRFDQENRSLKVDLKRHSDDAPLLNYMQEQLQQIPRSTKSQYVPSEQHGELRAETGEGERKTERRRGEFARERGQRRGEVGQAGQGGQGGEIRQAHTVGQQQYTTGHSGASQSKKQGDKDIGSAIRKMEQLNEQLQKLKDMKAMTGGMRRQKINIERQIQQLEQFVKSRQ